MARLYTNENFPQPAVQELRRLGHDVVTSHEAGQSGNAVPDDAVLAFAASRGRIVVTMNRRDFISLHHKSSEHAGIVVCSVDSDFKGLAERIDSALAEKPSMDRQLLRVNRNAS